MRARHFQAAIAIAVIGMSVAACSSSGSSTPGAASTVSATKWLTVIYDTDGLDNTYVAAQVKATQAQALADHIHLKVVNGQFDTTLQSQQMAEAIAEKPDGIIEFPNDSSAIVPETAIAHKDGIPVTFCTQDIASNGAQYRLAYSGPNNYTQGIHQFDLLKEGILANGVKGTPKIAMIISFPGSAANVLRVGGFNKEEATTGYKMDVVATAVGNSDVTESRSAAAQILTKYGSELNGIYAQDDNVAAGAAEAVAAAGLSKKIVIIGNGFEKIVAADIKAGTVYGTLDQSPVTDGDDCANVMNAILRHKPYQKVTYLPQPFITKANVDQYTAQW
jgi:ribose transport system substrate-binding protein